MPEILEEVRAKGVIGVLSERFPAIAKARARVRGEQGAGFLGFGFLGGRRTKSFQELPSFPGLAGLGGEVPERRIAGLEFGGQEIERPIAPLARRIAGLD